MLLIGCVADWFQCAARNCASELRNLRAAGAATRHAKVARQFSMPLASCAG